MPNRETKLMTSFIAPIIMSSPAGSIRNAENSSKQIIVTEIKSNDVLFGRGTSVLRHPGNVKFRELVKSRKAQYVATVQHEQKSIISKYIVDTITSRNGRFLREVASSCGLSLGTKTWTLASASEVDNKVKQALREAEHKPTPPFQVTADQKPIGSTDSIAASIAATNPGYQQLLLSLSTLPHANVPSGSAPFSPPAVGPDSMSLMAALMNTASPNRQLVLPALQEALRSIVSPPTVPSNQLMTLNPLTLAAPSNQQQLQNLVQYLSAVQPQQIQASGTPQQPPQQDQLQLLQMFQSRSNSLDNPSRGQPLSSDSLSAALRGLLQANSTGNSAVLQPAKSSEAQVLLQNIQRQQQLSDSSWLNSSSVQQLLSQTFLSEYLRTSQTIADSNRSEQLMGAESRHATVQSSLECPLASATASSSGESRRPSGSPTRVTSSSDSGSDADEQPQAKKLRTNSGTSSPSKKL